MKKEGKEVCRVKTDPALSTSDFFFFTLYYAVLGEVKVNYAVLKEAQVNYPQL